MQNAINGTGNGEITKPEEKPIRLNSLGVEHYGDYVNYPVSIGHGPDENAHKSDWRIFYNDGTYVYLIASYLLENSEVPIGISAVEGKKYATYWSNIPSTYITISAVVRNQYKMSWDKSTTNNNIKCISEVLDTTKWTKFVNNAYAEDAIGSPTLEMWVDSWNQGEGTTLYYNNSNEYGYYIGNSSIPTATSVNVSNSNTLYFPVRSSSDTNGSSYWIASPCASSADGQVSVGSSGQVSNVYDGNVSLRPLVRLKTSAVATKDANGVWQLQ